MRIAIKLDIDTLRGYVEGLPRLLSLFDKYGARASIFFSMGPDNSGKAIRRVFRRGFISKMMRTKAASTYGLRTMLYGTLLPAPMIVQSKPALLQTACEAGHDCGVHAWDHVRWQDELPKLSRDAMRAEFAKSFSLFESIAGVRPSCIAAPGWQITPDAIVVEDELALDYASDTRGEHPFFPAGGKTLQIPTTLPTMDELLGAEGVDEEGVADAWFGAMRGRSCEVLTIHTEMEGGTRIASFENFMKRAADGGAKFITLAEYASDVRAGEKNGKKIPACEIKMKAIFGRAGKVAIQQNPVASA